MRHRFRIAAFTNMASSFDEPCWKRVSKEEVERIIGETLTDRGRTSNPPSLDTHFLIPCPRLLAKEGAGALLRLPALSIQERRSVWDKMAEFDGSVVMRQECEQTAVGNVGQKGEQTAVEGTLRGTLDPYAEPSPFRFAAAIALVLPSAWRTGAQPLATEGHL